MTIGKAKEFIQRGMQDSALRERLNGASNAEAINTILKQEDLIFSASDFDEAFHNLLTQCQEKEQADQLREYKMWWDLTMSLMHANDAI
jgi:hypothetical protein